MRGPAWIRAAAARPSARSGRRPAPAPFHPRGSGTGGGESTRVARMLTSAYGFIPDFLPSSPASLASMAGSPSTTGSGHPAGAARVPFLVREQTRIDDVNRVPPCGGQRLLEVVVHGGWRATLRGLLLPAKAQPCGYAAAAHGHKQRQHSGFTAQVVRIFNLVIFLQPMILSSCCHIAPRPQLCPSQQASSGNRWTEG